MIKVLFVCHGNICRSTMAQSVFAHLAAEANLADYFEIDSAATSREEIGNTPHYGTVRKLREESVPLIPHRARQMTRNDYLYYDYLIGMDTANIRNMIKSPEARTVREKSTKCCPLRDMNTRTGCRRQEMSLIRGIPEILRQPIGM